MAVQMTALKSPWNFAGTLNIMEG